MYILENSYLRKFIHNMHRIDVDSLYFIYSYINVYFENVIYMHNYPHMYSFMYDEDFESFETEKLLYIGCIMGDTLNGYETRMVRKNAELSVLVCVYTYLTEDPLDMCMNNGVPLNRIERTNNYRWKRTLQAGKNGMNLSNAEVHVSRFFMLY